LKHNALLHINNKLKYHSYKAAKKMKEKDNIMTSEIQVVWPSQSLDQHMRLGSRHVERTSVNAKHITTHYLSTYTMKTQITC